MVEEGPVPRPVSFCEMIYGASVPVGGLGSHQKWDTDIQDSTEASQNQNLSNNKSSEVI